MADAPALERHAWTRTVSSGPRLSYAAMHAPNAKLVVAVVHGYAEYAERYEKVLRLWAERGISSVAIDLRGHGHSEGKRGHADSFNDFLDDFRELDAMVSKEAKALPRVLFAHSFGCVVSLGGLLAKIGSYRAVALSEPYLAPAFEVPALKVKAGHVMAKLWPSFSLPLGLTGAQMTDNVDAQREHDQDPLIFPNGTAGWFVAMQGAQDDILRRSRELELPLLITFGSADPIAREATAKRLFTDYSGKDKEWESLEGLRHEPLNDPAHRSRVAGRIADFLLRYA